MPPLGYDVKKRKLVVNDGEARIVVEIYRRYLALKSVHALRDETGLRGNSLLTGKITRNFTKIGPFGETVPVKMQQNQLVIGQFPTKLNRELIRAEQGIY